MLLFRLVTESQRGVQFRQWATKRIHEYIVKGFTLDDERLKGNGGGTYWKELLQRIQEIRTDERIVPEGLRKT